MFNVSGELLLDGSGESAAEDHETSARRGGGVEEIIDNDRLHALAAIQTELGNVSRFIPEQHQVQVLLQGPANSLGWLS